MVTPLFPTLSPPTLCPCVTGWRRFSSPTPPQPSIRAHSASWSARCATLSSQTPDQRANTNAVVTPPLITRWRKSYYAKTPHAPPHPFNTSRLYDRQPGDPPQTGRRRLSVLHRQVKERLPRMSPKMAHIGREIFPADRDTPDHRGLSMTR